MTLPRLTLPSGGWVEFNDPDNLRGRDYKKFRRAWFHEDVADRTNVVGQVLLELFVHQWELPYLPKAPIPSAEPGITDGLPFRDLKALEVHLAPVLPVLLADDATPSVDNTEPGSPTQPASE